MINDAYLSDTNSIFTEVALNSRNVEPNNANSHSRSIES
jgi:hypothetical protein